MKKIVIESIVEKTIICRGHVHPGKVLEGQHAEIVPGHSIVLYGEMKAGSRYVKNEQGQYDRVNAEPIPYRLEFKIGDQAEYDSYNAHYLGEIVSITAKSVTMINSYGKKSRLDIAEFSRRNHDFDAEKIAARNLDVYMTC
jgi:hypothetical protein